jgi:hypothetical protein
MISKIKEDSHIYYFSKWSSFFQTVRKTPTICARAFNGDASVQRAIIPPKMLESLNAEVHCER